MDKSQAAEQSLRCEERTRMITAWEPAQAVFGSFRSMRPCLYILDGGKPPSFISRDEARGLQETAMSERREGSARHGMGRHSPAKPSDRP